MSNIEVITNAVAVKKDAVAQLSDLALKDSIEEIKSAPSKKANGENTEESGNSENEETEVLDTKEGDENDSDNNESDTKEGDQKPKVKGGFKKRIKKLTNQLSEKNNELEYWKQEALKRQSSETENTQNKVQKKEADSKPKAEDFESHDEYIEALTDWKIEKRDKEKETKSKETQIKTEFDRQVEAHNKRVEKFVESHDDFHDLIEEIDDVPMSMAVQDLILRSENGPELMYELAKNRKDYERICALDPIQAAREFGKFEARVLKPSESSKEKQTTKAPPPIAPLKAKSSGSVKKTIFDKNLSQAEYEALRREQMRKDA